MAYMIGGVVGGALLIYLLSILFEWLIFKRVLDSRKAGVPASVLTGTGVAIVIAGFGAANGGSWNPRAAPIYIMSGILVLAIRMLTERPRKQEDVEEVFE